MYAIIEVASHIALTKVLGKPIVGYTIDLAKKLEAKEIYIITDMDIEIDGVKTIKQSQREELLKTLVGDVVKLDGCSIFYGGSDVPLHFETAADVVDGSKKIGEFITQLHIGRGVVIYDPLTTFIGPDAKIGPDTQIMPNTTITGNTTIGNSCIIGPNTSLDDMIIGDNTELQFTVARSSSVGNNSKIGPFAHIRPGCNIGNNAKVGNFVEVKNTKLGDGSKAGHLAYLGDAVIGDGVNIGCGAITVNYDGASKHETTIGDGVFVGCNVNMIAPVTLGDNSFVAAGSTVSKDVPEGALAVARVRQENKLGWKPPSKR